MAPTRVALILGSGPRVGTAVAERFAKEGYKVAIVSRSGKTAGEFLFLEADFTKPETIRPLFEKVKSEFGAFPSVVVYNAGALTPPPRQDSMFSIPSESVDADMKINTVSPYVAAQEAVKGWESMPRDTKMTFIYTGNILNTAILPVPAMMTLGMGKSASAYWVGTADAVYSSEGYRFYYADERYEDGKNKGQSLDGPAHAEFYVQLANHAANVPWHATFVKDKGYVQFK